MENLYLFSLKERKALVSGSTQGIGRGIAEIFAKAGASVTLIARNEESLKEVHSALAVTHDNQTHDYLVADFSNPDQVKNQVENYIKTKTGFDIIVNNTGGPSPGSLETSSVNDFKSAFDMHLVNNHNIVRANLNFMKEKGFGRIINVISTSVKQPIPNLGVSNTTRGAVASWSKTLATELGGYGITVNNILPGFIMTQRLPALARKRAEMNSTTEEEELQKMKNLVPSKKFGEPKDMGFAALYLASREGHYVNGTNIIVDGGRTSSL